MKLVYLTILLLLNFFFFAQKDGLKQSRWSIEAGMILNTSVSHYSTEFEYTDGAELQAVPSSFSSPVKFGAFLGSGFQLNKSKAFQITFNIGLSYSQGQYTETGFFIKKNNGPHGFTSTDVYEFENEVLAQYFFLSYGIALKIKLFKNLFLQNNINFFFSPYSIITTEYDDVYKSISERRHYKTQSYVASQAGVSCQLGMFYQVKIKPSLFDIGVYRQFCVTQFKLPLWLLSVRYYFP